MDLQQLAEKLRDPLKFAKALWPKVTFYDKQREIIESVRWNDETVVPAGNQLGKDYVGGFIVLWFFLTHHPVRIVTTSVKDDHLRVLWGELGRFIDTCAVPLKVEHGGPLVISHRDIRKVWGPRREVCTISYLRGMVSQRGEGMAGHHATYTLGLIDEASGVDNLVYTQMTTWAKRLLIIGNCNPCAPNHFFRKAVMEGDIVAEGV